MSIARTRAVTRPRAAFFSEMGWMEIFVCSQFLLSSVMLIPGTQSIRLFVRTGSYVACVFFWFIYHPRIKKVKQPPASGALMLALILLIVGIMNPNSAPIAGVAQCAFQLCIASPLFWGAGMVQSPARLQRLLWLILLANALNAGVGFLQTLYPDIFLPAEFNAKMMNIYPHYLEDMSYIGANGERIIRPPGLSDTPGGAALSGMLAGILGLTLASESSLKHWKRGLALACCFVSVTVIYLTQVRAFLIVLIAGLVVFGLVRHYKTRLLTSGMTAVVTILLVVSAYQVAIRIGGQAVSSRFLSVEEQGIYQSFQQNRGVFVEDTLGQLLWEYPFGAGVGRWGMMNTYFGQGDPDSPPPLWAEIQLTGWLYDGGILMWIFYGSAIILAMRFAYRVATRHPDPSLAMMAKIVLVLQLAVAASTLAGPTFNTPMGIQFWLLTSALYGACCFGPQHARQTAPGQSLAHIPLFLKARQFQGQMLR